MNNGQTTNETLVGKVVEQVRVTDYIYQHHIGRRSKVEETLTDEKGNIHCRTEDGIWCPLSLLAIE
jgi:hypothetical protein